MRSKPTETLTASTLIDASEFAAMLSVTISTLWGLRSAKLLPAPLRLSAKCLRWRRTDVEAWIASLDQQRPDVSTARDERSVVVDDDDSAKSTPWNRCEWLAFPGIEEGRHA